MMFLHGLISRFSNPTLMEQIPIPDVLEDHSPPDIIVQLAGASNGRLAVRVLVSDGDTFRSIGEIYLPDVIRSTDSTMGVAWSDGTPIVKWNLFRDTSLRNEDGPEPY